MKRNKTIAIFLLAFILFPLLCSIGLQLFQLYLKHRADYRLENENLTTVSIPLHKVKWVEKEREIMIEGKMFDIKMYSEQDGVLTATGVYDEKETAVLELLGSFSEKEQNLLLTHLLLLAQCFYLCYLMYRFYIYNYFINQFSFYTAQLSNPFQQKIFSPPRMLFN